MPSILFNRSISMSRRSLKASARGAMKSCVPLSAAFAAAWAIEFGFEVLCDCKLVIALMSGAGPPAKPMRQPVIGIGLGAAVHGKRAVAQPGLDLRRRHELEIVVDDMLVDVVAEHVNVRVAHQHVGERLHIGPPVRGARRVARRVEDEPFRPRRDRRLEILRPHAVAVVLRAGDEDRDAFGERDDIGIRDRVWRRDDDLLARLQCRHQRIVEHLLRPRGDDDLIHRVIEAVLALELVAHRLLQRGRAVGIGVFRLAPLDRRDGRALDVVGRIEIRLARAQRDDVASRCLELVARCEAIALGERLMRFILEAISDTVFSLGRADPEDQARLSTSWRRLRQPSVEPAARCRGTPSRRRRSRPIRCGWPAASHGART